MTTASNDTSAALDLLGGAVVRTLTGQPDLQWTGRTLYRGVDTIPLTAAHQHANPQTLRDHRSLLDSASLRLRISDASLHAAAMPDGDIEQLIFELLEQLRVESLAAPVMRGLRHNLAERFLTWSREFVDSGLTETSSGILILTLAVIAWSRLGGHDIPEPLSDLLEGTRANIVPEIGHALAGLKATRGDQRQFQVHALSLARWAGQAVQVAASRTGEPPRAFRSRNGFHLRLRLAAQTTDSPLTAISGESPSWQAGGGRYRVFTRAYDREAPAKTLLRAAETAALRAAIDQDVLAGRFNVHQLAREFERRLGAPRDARWRFWREEGLIDAARLSQIVSDPGMRHVFRDEEALPQMHTAVTLLLDCSGSMKAHAPIVSVMADVLGRALSMAGVRVEILGFSTEAWNGGRALRDWKRSGKPAWPGRLNESLHLVFKDARSPWRSGRQGLAALRRPDLFREGIDGEAVMWAAQRLGQQNVDRRILMVISDGCPMDSATHQMNDSHYLDHHLRQVVTSIETAGAVQICALGVGLDLGCFYRHRLALDLSEPLRQHDLLAVARFLSSIPFSRTPRAH
jgi:cobaltochelatase CobT